MTDVLTNFATDPAFGRAAASFPRPGRPRPQRPDSAAGRRAPVLLAGFWACTVVAMAGGAAPDLMFVYPAAAVLCGWAFIRKAPGCYVSLVWLLWFFTPCVRRAVEAGTGFRAFNPVMLAPPLTTALVLVRLLGRSHLWRRRDLVPFVLVFAGALYGFARGVGSHGLFGPAYDLLEWVVPPAFAAHLLAYREEWGDLRGAILRTFAVGLLVMGAYGMVQFVAPLPWDVAWMRNVRMASIGRPEPYAVRVFSTMNSPGPFSLVAMAGLLLMPAGRGAGRWAAAAPAAAAFLLSLVRAAWGGYAAGLAVIAARASGRLRGRLLALLAVLTVVGLPLLSIGPIADAVAKRMGSFESMRDDNSLNVRLDMYATAWARCLLNVTGEGLGSTGTASKLQSAKGALGAAANFDSGIMNVPYVLGWPGAALYVAGTATLLRRAWDRPAARQDLFLCACVGIAPAVLAQMVFVNTLIGVQGMVFWCFLGLALSQTPRLPARAPAVPPPTPPEFSHARAAFN